MAACTAKVYLFIGLGTIWLGLSSASWSFKEYIELEMEWDKCGFPPKQIYSENGTDLFQACKGDNLTPYVTDLCRIFIDFTYYECDNSPKYELVKKSILAMEFYRTSHEFYLCDENLGVRIPEGIRSRFKGEACSHTCSELKAENICRLLVIFAITDYKGLVAVVNQFTNSLASQANTSPVTSATGTFARENSTVTSASSSTEKKPASNTTQEQQASNTHDENTNSPSSNSVKTTQGKITLTYGSILTYGLLFLLICVGLFLVFYFRKTLLSCLRDNEGSPSTSEDGKGSYRRIPAFEKVVPSLDDTAKAKSYIY